jgi:hypothetical protein
VLISRNRQTVKSPSLEDAIDDVSRLQTGKTRR